MFGLFLSFAVVLAEVASGGFFISENVQEMSNAEVG